MLLPHLLEGRRRSPRQTSRRLMLNRHQPLLLLQFSRVAGGIGRAVRSDKSGCNSSGHKRSSSPFARQKRLFTRSLTPRRSKPAQNVLIGGCPGSNGLLAMLALPPLHRWKLFFLGFLHRSFRRSTSPS